MESAPLSFLFCLLKTDLLKLFVYRLRILFLRTCESSAFRQNYSIKTLQNLSGIVITSVGSAPFPRDDREISQRTDKS